MRIGEDDVRQTRRTERGQVCGKSATDDVTTSGHDPVTSEVDARRRDIGTAGGRTVTNDTGRIEEANDVRRSRGHNFAGGESTLFR